MGDEGLTGDGQLDFPTEGRDRNLTYAFIKAYDLCFQTAPKTIREYADIIDKVFLPFYRYRWLLYEIWAMLWVRNTVPASRRPAPLLSPRAGQSDSLEWVIPGGDAHVPVAVWTGDGKTIELWYQQKTPLAPEHAAKFGQKHIEPDVRIRGGLIGNTSDIVILELKDRHKAAGSKQKKIARMYATTGARLVCLTNYSEFGPRDLRGKVYEETADGGTKILLIDEFKPGQIPTEVIEALARAFAEGGRGLPTPFDLIGDISISMSPDAIPMAVRALVGVGLMPARVFAFDTDLKELPDLPTDKWPTGGATKLQTCLHQYLHDEGRAAAGKAIILTDDDGVEQFQCALDTGEFDALKLRCIDVTEVLTVSEIAEWIDD